MADDREIWKKISQHDAEAFETFYRENAARLRAFLQHIVRDRQTAEDIVQEAFTQIWNRTDGFQPERGSLRLYLFGIGRKRASEWWRKHRPTDSLVGENGGEDRTEIRSLVGDAFHRLPEDQRMLLWLREVEGLSYEELATTLTIPVGTVRSRLFAAREALRKIWKSEPHENSGRAV